MRHVFLLFLLAVNLLPHLADAHVLEKDVSVGAILHISPDDDPLAKQESSFYFDFKDKAGKFTLENCDCTVIIRRAGEPIISKPLAETNTVIFPAKDVYTIEVHGSPREAGVFEPFTLSYDLRVEREAVVTPPSVPNWFSVHVIHLIGVSIFTIVVFAMIIKDRFFNKESHV